MALEAVKGVKTIQEIANEFGVPTLQVCEWPKTMAKNAAIIFAAGAAKTDAEVSAWANARLHAKIGQLAERE